MPRMGRGTLADGNGHGETLADGNGHDETLADGNGRDQRLADGKGHGRLRSNAHLLRLSGHGHWPRLPTNGRRRRLFWVLGAGLVTLALGAGLHAADLLRRVDLLTVDARFDVRGAQTAPDDIVIVGIDDRTFDDYAKTPFPFPRNLHARVIERLVDAGARAIAYDVQFTEPSLPERHDVALINAVERARGRIVLATTETDGRGGTRVLGGDDLLQEIGARAGNAIVIADPSGVVRRTPYEVDGLRAFAVVAAELASGRRVQPFDGDSAWIDFRGPPGTFAHHSFSSVQYGDVPPSAFRDKIVVVGATAPSLQDVSATSTSGHELMSGPELQAEAISTILRGFPLREAPGWVGWVLVLVLGAVPVVAAARLRPVQGFFASVLAGVLFAVGAYLAFRAGLIVPMVAPLVTLAASAVAVLAALEVQEAMERQRVHDVFARFVGEQVVDDVLERAGDDLRLGGERRECTVMFTDLRGFTSYGETTSPDTVIYVLNAYLTEMSDAILDNGGTLISYMGDGIMAVFGAPLDQPDHRDRALATAREMLVRLERFNVRMRLRGIDRPFEMGIGINTGDVMCGNVGSERRLEYTAIGDTTNTAARLEGMTKESGYAVFVADSTRSGLRSEPDDLELVADMPVRGRREAVRVWGLRTPAEGATLHQFPLPVTVTRAIRARGDAMYLDRLKDVPFFGSLSKKELTAVARQTDEIDVPAGKVLIRQGELGQEFFVIEEGTAEVAKDGQKVSELKAGDFFGEMALLDEDRRTATVTALTPMTLIVMTRADFRAIDRELPRVHEAVSEAIAQRRAAAAS